MMTKKLYIRPEFILNHIDTVDLDLTDLPQFPVRLLGIVDRCYSDESYAFVITNAFGIDTTTYASPQKPISVFLNKKQWKGSRELKEGIWVTFDLVRQHNKEHHAAIEAKDLEFTLEDYLACKKYLGEYGEIKGRLNGTSYDLSIKTEIYNIFFLAKKVVVWF